MAEAFHGIPGQVGPGQSQSVQPGAKWPTPADGQDGQMQGGAASGCSKCPASPL